MILDPQGIGFEQRYSGVTKTNVVWGTLSAIGPFHEISADGHEKLSAQALQMGDISLLIYRYKDKWADNILKLSLIPDCQTAGAVGHLFLDFVEEIGGDKLKWKVASSNVWSSTIGIPLQLTTDKGPEIGWQYTFQAALWWVQTSRLCPKLTNCFHT